MIEAPLFTLVLVFVRVAACIASLPAPLGRGTPSTLKIGLSAALAWFFVLSTGWQTGLGIWSQVVQSNSWFWIAWLSARETVLGIGIGWSASLMLIPARTAGAYLAQEIGLSLGSVASPQDQSPSNVFSNIFEGFATVALIGLNLHHVWIWTLLASLTYFPVGGAWVIPSLESSVDRVAQAEQLGLASIGPLIVVLFLTLVLVLATARLAPQAGLFNFGMPLRSLIGCAAAFLFWPEILLGLQRSLEFLSINLVH